MIWFFKLDRAIAGSCKNYDNLLTYITDKEKRKLIESHPELEPLPEQPWSFTFFTPQQVSALYDTGQPLLTAMIKEAHEKKLGFIEIRQGNPQELIEILVTSEVDIEAIKKQWCFDYCKAHNYLIVENFSHHSSHSVQTQWRREGACPLPAQELLPQVSPSEVSPKCSSPFQALPDAQMKGY